jgi:hypothetical protein
MTFDFAAHSFTPQRRTGSHWNVRSERSARGAGEAGEPTPTFRVLQGLESQGWHRLDDLQRLGSQSAAVDHVLVGPGGIFVIGSRDWGGPLSVRSGMLRPRGALTGEARAVGEATAAVGSFLSVSLRRYVVPVLSLVRDDELTAAMDNVRVCSTASLRGFILQRGRVLSSSQISEALASLRAVLGRSAGNERLEPRAWILRADG